jgi:hypothetical protein
VVSWSAPVLTVGVTPTQTRFFNTENKVKIQCTAVTDAVLVIGAQMPSKVYSTKLFTFVIGVAWHRFCIGIEGWRGMFAIDIGPFYLGIEWTPGTILRKQGSK